MRRRLPTGPFSRHGRESVPSIVSAVLLAPAVVLFVSLCLWCEHTVPTMRRVLDRLRYPQ